MKPLRLPDPCTVEQAAQWLSREATEEWTDESVLSRFLEFTHEGNRAFAPPTLLVVIGPDTELLDKENEFAPVKFGCPVLLAVTVPVDRFIHDLLLAGVAMPQGLATREAPFKRYMPTAPISLKAVRMPREWVRDLLPAYDDLIHGIRNGEHQGFMAELHKAAFSLDEVGKPPEPRERRRKKALIDEVKDIWESVKEDIRHMGENGLRETAYIPGEGGKIGWYDKAAALRWARENGKLIKTADGKGVDAINPIEAINRRGFRAR